MTDGLKAVTARLEAVKEPAPVIMQAIHLLLKCLLFLRISLR